MMSHRPYGRASPDGYGINTATTSREVQRETGMSDAELHELKEFGSDKTRTSGVKHKVRWFQQTLRQAGVIERVPEKRGVWRYSSKTKQTYTSHGKSSVLSVSQLLLGHRFWKRLCLLQQYHRANSSLPDLAALPPSKFKRLRAWRGRGEQVYIDWLLRILEPIVKQLVPGASVALNITQDSFNRGRPSRSLYLERLTLALCDKLGLELMDRLQWVNRSKPHRQRTGHVSNECSSAHRMSLCCGLPMMRVRFVQTTYVYCNRIQSSILNCRQQAVKIARPFMVMGRTSLKADPLEIKQKERSPKILCFTAIAALIRDFAIPLPAS